MAQTEFVQHKECSEFSVSRVLLGPAGQDQAHRPVELFRFEAGKDAPRQANTVPIGLLSLESANATEIWEGTPPTFMGTEESVHLCGNSEYALGHMKIPLPNSSAIARQTRDSYQAIIRRLRDNGFSHLGRTWNFIPNINFGEGDAEVYRQFCIGRAEALGGLNFRPADLPAGTGVGTPDSETLVIAILATKRPIVNIENPRQVPAYNYPRQYGPRSPAFARATIVETGGARKSLFVSGTASVVGHESVHRGSAVKQTQETINNLVGIVRSATQVSGTKLEGTAGLRVYIRDRADFPAIRAQVQRGPFGGANAMYLNADLCRSELLVEIELVASLA